MPRHRTVSRRMPSRVRQAAVDRDGGLCHFCGTDALIEVHHLDGIWSGRLERDDSPTNLLALCRGCHDLVHAERVVLTPEFLDRLARIRAGDEALPPLPVTELPTPGKKPPAAVGPYSLEWSPLYAFYAAHPDERSDV